jgi:phosphate acetyltransferase
LAAPINDLSRGCSVNDIVELIAITANQAMGKK